VPDAGVVSGASLFRPDAIEEEASVTSSSDILAANPTRELAAIMFSDIVGYTAIMGRDEQLAMRALAAHRELLRSIVPRFNGRQVGEIGDGTLSSFHSAFDAVSCAREIQASLAGDSELRIRIGIHVGDVVFTNNTVLGDGVNVASRIHELAPPGGVCISERVFDDIRNKPGIQAQDLGQKTLKNVNRPIRAYLLTTASPESVTSRSASADSRGSTGFRRSRALMVPAVLIFAVLAGYFVYRYHGRNSSAPAIAPAQSAPPPVEQRIAFCTSVDGVRIAYATVGKASAPAVVEIVGWFTDLGSATKDPSLAATLNLAEKRFYYVRYDGRGSGLSDRGVRDYSLDARVHDLEAVMDALKIQRAALVGDSAGGATAIAYAARHPERVNCLVLYGSFARLAESTDARKRWEAMITLARSGWGTDNPAYREMFTALFMPDGTESEMRRFSEKQRTSATPEDAANFMLASLNLDVSALAPKVRAPTLLIHRRGDLIVPFEQGRKLAALIPGARLVSLDSRNHASIDGDPTNVQAFDVALQFIVEHESTTAAKH